MTYDNIKSHKNPGFHPLSRRHIFEKITGEGGWGVKLILCFPPTANPHPLPHPAFSGLKFMTLQNKKQIITIHILLYISRGLVSLWNIT